MRTPELRELALRFSIEPAYVDATGKRRAASRDALVALIESRSGVSLTAARDLTPERRLIEPVIVVWGTRPPRLRIGADAHGILEWDVELEDGSWRAGRGEAQGGVLTLDLRLPQGYHTLFVNGVRSLLIAAPLKAEPPPRRDWGIFAPLYAARTRRSWGAGDLGDLFAYSEWIAGFGAGVVATLPMLATFDDEPSPYSPVSRLYWNEVYLDPARMPEYQPEDADLSRIAHLQQSAEVLHREVRREKRRVLERCADRFRPDAEFARFADRARDYAEFRARAEDAGDAADVERRTRYHLYVQYRMAAQMRQLANLARRRGSGLYLDFPLGVNPSGYDAWRYSDLFSKGAAVGAPPDAFFTRGQNWGFPPLDPDAVRVEEYRYFRDAVRHHVSHAGILRLDHVMGLHRLYWIPSGNEARDGAYVRYRAEELYAILTLESRRHACAIVGEDLGTVPPEVPRMMRRHGLRRMYVVQYEIRSDAQPPLPEPPAESVASINTHDMPPFASFWGGRDIGERLDQKLLDQRGAQGERESRESIRRALIRFLRHERYHHDDSRETGRVLASLVAWLAASSAEIVLLNLEDLWGEVEAQNMPGVPDRSWRHKFRMGLEEMQSDGGIRRLLSSMQQLRAQGLLRNETESTVRAPETMTKEG